MGIFVGDVLRAWVLRKEIEDWITLVDRETILLSTCELLVVHGHVLPWDFSHATNLFVQRGSFVLFLTGVE